MIPIIYLMFIFFSFVKIKYTPFQNREADFFNKLLLSILSEYSYRATHFSTYNVILLNTLLYIMNRIKHSARAPYIAIYLGIKGNSVRSVCTRNVMYYTL